MKSYATPARVMGSIATLALWCVPAALAAAPGAAAQYRFDSWTTDDGLPHKAVHALLQTRDGYLRLTTTDGLVRFDGVRFTVSDTAGGEGFKSNRCTALYEDSRGDLWIGTEDNGLMRYRDGRFTSYTTAEGLHRNDVRAIGETESGDLLVITFGGVAQLREGRFVPYPVADRLPLAGVVLDRLGGLWHMAGNIVRRTTPAGTTLYPLDPRLGHVELVAAYLDRQGGVWFSAKELGIAPGRHGLYHVNDGRTTVYTLKDGLAPSAVRSFYEDREGTLWLGTLESGLLRLRDGRFTRYTTADGLSSNRVTAIYQDREGSIWAGTVDNGLNRMRRRVVETFSTANGLAADNTYPIYQDAAGAVWVGSWGGLTKIENGRFTHFYEEDGMRGLPMSLFQDREGTLWIGSFGSLIRVRGGRFELLAVLGERGKIELPDAATPAIEQDREGAMWFGTVEGLARYKDGALTVYTTADGLPNNYVQAIHFARDGKLRVGTRGGLASFDGARFAAYAELGDSRVRCIYEDADGVLWVGTYDGGLFRLQGGRVTRYTAREGLFNNGVFQILEDGRGRFWMSCNKGIYSVSRRELNDFAEGKVSSVTSTSFDRKDGMLDEECNGGGQPAGWRMRDGRLWFPTQKGVAVIDPEAVPHNAMPPPVLIEDFLVERRPVALGETVMVGPGLGDVEIHYTGLSFIKSEHVKFKYQLVGLDRDWVDAGTRRAVYYSHLPPGDYTFRVIAANADGVWNTEGARVRIRVLPPFYRTWWFVTAAALFVAAAAFLLYRRRVSHLKRARAAQEEFARRLIESQEQERKRIAAELHDGLGQDLLIIKNRAVLGRMQVGADGAAAGEQLDEISESASQAIDEVREIAYNLRPHHLDRLGLTKTLVAMVDKAAAASDTRFACRVADLDGALPKSSEINFYRVVQECINNILRHSRASEAWVEIDRDERALEVKIGDNGRGFAPEAAAASRGFGLTGIGERVRMLGGSFAIHTAPGGGTRVAIKLPLPKDGGST